MQLKSTCGPHVMLSRFTIRCAKHYASNWFNCLSFLGKVRKVFWKGWEVNAVMKRKDSNWVGVLSDQGKAATDQTSVNILQYHSQESCCFLPAV